MFVVTIYDIRDNKRRNKLHRRLLNFADPVQFSAFEAFLDPGQLKRMAESIRGAIEDSQDKVRLYCLCETCYRRIRVLGQGKVTEDRDILFV